MCVASKYLSGGKKKKKRGKREKAKHWNTDLLPGGRQIPWSFIA